MYAITQEQIDNITTTASKVAVDAYKKERAKEDKKKEREENKVKKNKKAVRII